MLWCHREFLPLEAQANYIALVLIHVGGIDALGHSNCAARFTDAAPAMPA